MAAHGPPVAALRRRPHRAGRLRRADRRAADRRWGRRRRRHRPGRRRAARRGAALSAGCVDGEGLPEGETNFTLEARTRRYVVRLPVGYTRDRAWPLVLALHGNGGSIAEWDGTTGTKNIRGALADAAVLIVAEAIDGHWRDYAADASTWPARVESELLYFDEIITRAKTALCIDEDAIFSMGFSGGGWFSGVLGCRRTDIRAIAVGGSVIYLDTEACVGHPAAWITIGAQELEAPRETYRDFWRDRSGCAATSTATDPRPASPTTPAPPTRR